MKIIIDTIGLDEIKAMAAASFGDFVKAVVDIDKSIMAVDAELHSDLEAALLANGSSQRDLWGINLYPGLGPEEFVEFDSMINLRPGQGNRSRGVEDPLTREAILAVVERKVQGQ